MSRALGGSAWALLLLVGCSGWRKQVKEGDRWMEANNPAAAARAYNRAYDKRPEDPELQLKLARALLASGKPFDALPLAEGLSSLEEPPEGTQALYIEVLVKTWRIEPALEQLGDSPPPELLPLASEAWLAAGDLDRAAEALSGADPTPANRAALAYVEARRGNTEGLAELADEAYAWGEVPTEAWTDVAAALFVAGDFDAAQEIGGVALGNDPSVVLEKGLRAVWMDHADKASETQRHETALRYDLRAASLDVEDAELCWSVGKHWFALEQLASGAVWMEMALSTPPFDAPDPNAVVAAATTGGMPAEDRNAIRVAIARPLADAYFTLQRPKDEVRAMTWVVQAQDPPVADDLMRLSAAHSRAGQHLQAAEAAQVAANLGHPRAPEQAARAYAAAGKLGEAIGWATTALDRDPTNPDLALLLAELYSADGRYQAAMEILDRGIAANPDDRRLKNAQRRILDSP